MSRSLEGAAADFRVEIGDDGIAGLILVQPGTTRTTDATGHAELTGKRAPRSGS